MYKTPLRNFVSGTNKKEIQRHPIIMTDADYDYILDEIEISEKLSLKRMWVLIVWWILLMIIIIMQYSM